MSGNVKRIVSFFVSILCIVLLTVSAYASESFSIRTLEQRGTNYVYLKWDEYAGADGYTVYRSEDNNTFKLVKHVTSCDTYNYSLENGKTYAYKVRPYRVLDSGSKQYLAESGSVAIPIGVKTPDNLNVRANGKTSMEISWDGDPMADSYRLYRSTDNTNWTLIKSVYGTSTITYGLHEGETYYFRVKATRNINNILRFSEYSDSVGCTLGVETPSYLTINSTNKNSVELKWERVKGATGYRLYRAENDGEYKLVKTVTDTTTKNYNLRPDVTYTYRIAAIAEGATYTFKSEYVYSEPIRLALDPVDNLHVEKYYSNGVSLGWDAVNGATGYRLYRTSETGVTTLVKTITDNTTNTYSLVNGQCYRFFVKPICQSGTATVNGSNSEELAVFFTAQPHLTITQSEVNKIHLHWDNVAGAEKYSLSIAKTGDTEITQELSGTDMEYVLSDSGEISVDLKALKGGIESVGVKETFIPIYEKPLSFAIAKAIEETKVSLAWEPLDLATRYEVQRLDDSQKEFVTVAIGPQLSLVDDSVLPNTAYQYRYRAEYLNGNSQFWGNWSETANVNTPNKTQYRALLIGEENYDEVLDGPINDIEAMDNMLSGLTAMNWSVYRQADATYDEITSLISLAFAGATENDISLFYYSGHGVMGSGDYYAGALATVDNGYIPLQRLAEMLSAVPGKVIVLLDSCGSGAAISGGTESAATYSMKDMSIFDPASFNEQVVEIFSVYNEKEQNKSGEFATDKFYVLTSSAYEQTSKSLSYGKLWGGAFTRGLVASVGYDFDSKSWSETMYADVDGDNCLTLKECYTYCYNHAIEYQNVQGYPLDSSVRLFYK